MAKRNDKTQEKKNSSIRIWLSILRALILLSIFAALIMFLYMNRENISNDTIGRIFSVFDPGGEVSADGNITIYYDSGETNRYAVFNKSFAVLHDGKLEVFDRSGKTTLSERLDFTADTISADSRFIAAYSVGGTKLAVFNTKNEIFHKTFDHPICFANVTQGGYTIAVTADEGFAYAVTVFDTSQKQIYRARIASTKHVVAADISPDNRQLAVLWLNSAEPAIKTELAVFDLKSENEPTPILIGSSTPMSVDFSDNNSITVITDSDIQFISAEDSVFSVKSTYDFGGEILWKTASGDVTAVMLDKYGFGDTCRLIIFDKDGSVLCSQSLNFEIRHLSVYGERIFILDQSRQLILNSSGEIEHETKADGDSIAFFGMDDDTAVAASVGHAMIEPIRLFGIE